MDSDRFDSIARRFAGRKLSRRAALARGSTGLAAGALAAAALGRAPAQAGPDTGGNATPGATAVENTEFLFVQSFQAGSIAPMEGIEGRYTVSLEEGLGQTIYFSNRPERIVGAEPTPRFLEGMPFLPENPPNAALIMEAGDGETDIAVVELFNPTYDPETRGVTYEVEVLADWQNSQEAGFAEASSDLATLAPTFGAAHLFIDDCPDLTIYCYVGDDQDNAVVGEFDDQGMCWNYSLCIPCEPYGHTQPDRCATKTYWENKCNSTFERCRDAGGCWPYWYWPAINFLCPGG